MTIYVTQPSLPKKEEFLRRVDAIFQKKILTNEGPQVKELESKLGYYLKVPHFHYVTNGTVALQLLLRAFDITDGEIITSPFSYVATTSSILWERCTPTFVDIEPNNFTIDPDKIEEAITPKTKAILPVHVFGYSCQVNKIQEIANKHNLKVIYDAAHTFGSFKDGRALCSFGDGAAMSFHATKIFHTIEGGGCIVKNSRESQALNLLKKFGHIGDTHQILGINGKQDEFNAAMGLSLLPDITKIIKRRQIISDIYTEYLKGKLELPASQEGLEYNYSYYPVLFENEEHLKCAFKKLNQHDVFPRRYFYPSLNNLPYLPQKFSCPISENISSRIACLPLYPELKEEDAAYISKLLSNA